jgi:hypothetical protein
MRVFRTLLERKIWERRQTFEEFVEFAEVFAREHGEPGSVSARHVQRLAGGRGPGGRPLGPVRPATARLLERIFGVSVDELLSPPVHSEEVVQDLDDEPAELLDGAGADGIRELAGWLPDSTRRKVAVRLENLDLGHVRDRRARLRRVGRSQLAHTLADYYADGSADYQLYRVDVDGQAVLTSVLSRLEWSEIAVPLTAETDRVALVDVELDGVGQIGNLNEHPAVDRLAEAAALGVRMTNKPLYRLLDVDVRDGVISGRVGLAHFGVYALTMDLLESELAEELSAGQSARSGRLPMRDRLLPNLAAVLDLQGRLCAGGVASLCAIARPADAYRGPADYALLVQERSGQVVNAAGRLAVIPKGFHEPLSDVRADARISATLQREMEEELFGRVDVDSTASGSRAALPMHPDRLSDPMRWLLDVPDRLRTECTGFGLNLVSGNYEFAGLVAIENEEFWTRFGGHIEANWESSGLRLYSSLDGELISKLVMDEAWTNEGLFAFLQGLRRLREIGGRRVSLPAVDVVSGR